MDRPSNDVLIVGAGPTGLVLALWLTRLGIQVRIFDKTLAPGTTSRALAVQARTLELYRQIGIADEVVAAGVALAGVRFQVRGAQVGRAAFGEIGRGMSPFPYVLDFPQDQHEELLLRHLRAAGVDVERGVELLGFEERGEGVSARVRRADGAEAMYEAAFIAGCDGAHSRVREAVGIGFPGGIYERVFYVADVVLRGLSGRGELQIALDEADFLGVFPMKGEGAARLIGTVRRDAADRRDLGWDDVSRSAVERMGITVEQLRWFSTYRVHHRVAERFQRGRAFLAGDAAHIHSPVGGQGMNTGIGDAVNLAWKLAAVLKGEAGRELLDSYEAERIGFARRLVATTDRLFTFATAEGSIARALRTRAAPILLPALMRRRAFRRFLFRTVSQTGVSYRGGSLGEGSAGAVRGGDRLPWVAPGRPGDRDNFTPLASLAWQVHVYGDAPAELVKTCARRGVGLVEFPWRGAMAKAGIARGAAYLVRPDGYVALADAEAKAATLERYLDGRGLKFAVGGARSGALGRGRVERAGGDGSPMASSRPRS